MKVKVCYSVDVSGPTRRAMRRYVGRAGEATREEVVAWYKEHGDSLDATLRVLVARGERK